MYPRSGGVRIGIVRRAICIETDEIMVSGGEGLSHTRPREEKEKVDGTV